MKWTVEGASMIDGSDQTVTLEAPTSREAETRARARGMLVSTIKPAAETSETLSYASPHLGRVKPVFESVPKAKPQRDRGGIASVIAYALALAGLVLIGMGIHHAINTRPGSMAHETESLKAIAGEMVWIAEIFFGIFAIIAAILVRILIVLSKALTQTMRGKTVGA